ncbi:MAG: hypothetical protein ACJ762_06500 [Solirubrobacteraceae bacterium]
MSTRQPDSTDALPAPRRWRLLSVALLVGAVGGAVASELHGPAVIAILALWPFVALGSARAVAFNRYRSRCRTLLEALVQLEQKPPADATAVTCPMALEWCAAMSREDWPAVAALTSDNFRWTSTMGSGDAKQYVRGLKMSSRAYHRTTITLLDCRAQPRTDSVLYLKMRQVSRRRHGRPLDTTWWERWSLAPGGLVGEIELVGVVDVA